MKLSVSISDDDVAVLDDYVAEAGLPSRSAAVQHAIRLLRHAHLEDEYAAAWSEWEQSGDAAAWQAALADGIVDATG
jgi:Arc/MetJ-type ribon-helix-helix transcriptional regulator